MDSHITAAEGVFIAFGLALEALLVGFFGVRRWAPQKAHALGGIVYGFGWLGLPIGIGLLLNDQSWKLFAGPLLAAAWASFGGWVDLVRPRRWRGKPVNLTVLAPYVVLYLAAQMFLWWPMWDIERAAWLVFLILFVPSTLLNIGGHLEDGVDR